MCNQLYCERALEVVYVLLDRQWRAHSEELETMCMRMKKMLDRHVEDMQGLEGLTCYRLHSHQSASYHKVRKNDRP